MTAAVIDLNDWRETRRVQHLPRLTARPHGWHDLAWIAHTDKRDALRIYNRLGLHPLVLHGLNADGACTCDQGRCKRERKQRGKHPVCRGWESGGLDLGRADQLLLDNWRRNVGLRMGRQPNGWRLIAIDVDGPLSLLEFLERQHGRLPETLTARTGSGGFHLIYRLPDGMATPGNRVRLGDRVDIRSERGQIVAPPSAHYSGHRYEWIHVMEPAELPA